MYRMPSRIPTYALDYARIPVSLGRQQPASLRQRLRPAPWDAAHARPAYGSPCLYRAGLGVVQAPTIAVAIVLVGPPIPGFAQKSTALRGEVSGGAGLLLTRLVVSAQAPKIDTNIAMQAVMANVAHPIVVAGLAWLVTVGPLATRMAILLSALPAGFLAIFFGLRFRLMLNSAGSTMLSALALSTARY